MGCCVGGRNGLGFWTRGENDSLLVWAWKLTYIFGDGQNWLDFSVGDRSWLGSSVGLNWFGCCLGGRNWLVTCMLTENHIFLVWTWKWLGFCVGGSKLTWFQCVGSNLTSSQCRDELDWVVVWVVEIDVVLERGAKITCFEWEHGSRHAFLWVFYIDFISLWGVELDLIPV